MIRAMSFGATLDGTSQIRPGPVTASGVTSWAASGSVARSQR